MQDSREVWSKYMFLALRLLTDISQICEFWFGKRPKCHSCHPLSLLPQLCNLFFLHDERRGRHPHVGAAVLGRVYRLPPGIGLKYLLRICSDWHTGWLWWSATWLGWLRFGEFPRLVAVTVATYCPSRMVEHPKSNSAQPSPKPDASLAVLIN